MKPINRMSYRDLPAGFESLVRMHPPCAIHDNAGYQNAQEVIDLLTSVPRLSKGQSLYLDTLTTLVEAYENEHQDFEEDVCALDVLQHLMESHEMSASDLGRLLGERSLGSKVLRGERELSKQHIRTLADHFGVDPGLFL